MKSIVVVEDDPTLAEVLELHLQADGYDVRTADDGITGLARCAESLPDLVLLDVMLPEKSGLEVCVELRKRFGSLPGIIMLTALGTEADIVCGLDAGADDYVVKPIRPRELLARVRSLSRRLAKTGDATTTFGRLVIDPDARAVRVDGQQLKLTATEFELLQCLSRAPERVFSRAELLHDIFDTEHAGYARNVDCHVTRVRRKLEAAGLSPTPIETVHGTGYRFVPPC
jgi:DNA-binding response OmpR family regulator